MKYKIQNFFISGTDLVHSIEKIQKKFYCNQFFFIFLLKSKNSKKFCNSRIDLLHSIKNSKNSFKYLFRKILYG